MSIDYLKEKVKPTIEKYYTLILLLVIATIFFGLGRLSILESQKTSINIQEPSKSYKSKNIPDLPKEAGSETISSQSSQNNTNSQTGAVINSQASVPSNNKEDGQVIGSKSGKKYYFPWCGTVKRIKEENKVHFDSIAAAKAAGFIPGGNCKGLW
jgi:hypothetical protein